MITEVLLILPLYLILFLMWWQFGHTIKMLKTCLNYDDFFGDTIDTPKEGIE